MIFYPIECTAFTAKLATGSPIFLTDLMTVPRMRWSNKQLTLLTVTLKQFKRNICKSPSYLSNLSYLWPAYKVLPL